MRGRFMALFALFIAALFALAPAAVLAADATDAGGDFLLKVGGPVTLSAGERAETIVVIDADATISGTVTDTLIVIDGDAVVLDGGVVRGDLYVIDGTLELASGSRAENVMLWDSSVTRAPDAIVTGTYDTDGAIDLTWTFGVLSVAFWAGTTLFVLLAGFLFAAIGWKQLRDAGRLLTDAPGSIAIATVLLVIGLPVVAIGAIVTLIGIPVGIGLLLFVLPMLLFLGYLTAGIELGSAIIRRSVPVERPAHAFLAALVGLLLLQVIGFIPWIGFPIVLLAGTVGAGMLVLLAWRAWRGPGRANRVGTGRSAGQPTPA